MVFIHEDQIRQAGQDEVWGWGSGEDGQGPLHRDTLCFPEKLDLDLDQVVSYSAAVGLSGQRVHHP